MKLLELINIYINYKRSLNMSFRSETNTLNAFYRAIGNIELNKIELKMVSNFIDGKGPVTANWHQKFKIVKGFYRFLTERGYTDSIPLPVSIPKCPPPLPPYIYSNEELQRLLVATEQLRNPSSPLQHLTFRSLFLLLYGTGMRINEALSLTLKDVKLTEQLLTVHDTKFHKSRLVPFGPKLTQELMDYDYQRRMLQLPEKENSAFFATRTGHKLSYTRASKLFRRIRSIAEIHREAEARYQPRIHDIRYPNLNKIQTFFKDA